MRRHLYASLAAVVTVLTAAGMPGATAQASAAHPRPVSSAHGTTFFTVCPDNGAGDECAQARFRTAGSHIEGEPFNGSGLQHWAEVVSARCGGHVTSTCPSGQVFRQWDGCPMVMLQVQDGGLWLVTGQPGVVIQPAGSNGIVWIACGASLINESETAQAGTGFFLTAPDTGGDVYTTGGFVSGDSQFGLAPA